MFLVNTISHWLRSPSAAEADLQTKDLRPVLTDSIQRFFDEGTPKESCVSSCMEFLEEVLKDFENDLSEPNQKQIEELRTQFEHIVEDLSKGQNEKAERLKVAFKSAFYDLICKKWCDALALKFNEAMDRAYEKKRLTTLVGWAKQFMKGCDYLAGWYQIPKIREEFVQNLIKEIEAHLFKILEENFNTKMASITKKAEENFHTLTSEEKDFIVQSALGPHSEIDQKQKYLTAMGSAVYASRLHRLDIERVCLHQLSRL